MSGDHTMTPSGATGSTLERWTGYSRSDAPATATCDAAITGASGFIGFNFARRLLADGKRVRLLARRFSALHPLEQQGAELRELDLLDVAALTRALQGAKTVYHLAAKTSSFSADEMFRVNAEGTRNVARACLALSPRPVLVYVSSIAAAGPATRGQIRKETDPPAPVSNYGRSKLAGEQALLEFASELPITIVRPGIVYGSWNRDMLPIFQSIQRFNLHATIGWRTPPLSLLHVDDTIEIMLRAARSGSRLPPDESGSLAGLCLGEGVYFAVGREFPTYTELGRMIGSLMGRPLVTILPLLGPAPWLAAGVNEVLSRLRGYSDTFNCDKVREALCSSWACSSEKVAHDLCFSPPSTLLQRLEETIAWYREHRWL